ncbi:MAG TPA: hypothetical protein VF865_21760 [Acidobacteriaceae bacterium]
MLDIHPAHHAANSWKEFFVHIATIVLGLLIAVGLEQTVEYFHHLHLASEAREQLTTERHLDERSNEVNIFTTLHHQNDLKHDLSILHALKTHAPLPNGPFIWRRFRFVYAEDTWLKLHQSGTITYLDNHTLSTLAYRYFNQQGFAARATESMESLDHSASVLRTEKDASQASLDESVVDGNFLNSLVDGHFSMDESAIQRGYASRVEHADLTKLAPAEIDELERAIKVALADDDAELGYCYNVKRNLRNNPGL